MPTTEIADLQRIFLTRLDTLSHLLDLGAKHGDLEAALQVGDFGGGHCVAPGSRNGISNRRG